MKKSLIRIILLQNNHIKLHNYSMRWVNMKVKLFLFIYLLIKFKLKKKNNLIESFHLFESLKWFFETTDRFDHLK